jgi:nucleoside phosphorylase
MSLIYIFTFSKVETEQVGRLMGATVKGNPTARAVPSHVGPNEVVLFASDMGPKIARSLANSVLNDGDQTHGQEFGNPKPDAILSIGLCGGLTADLRQNTVVSYTECRSTDEARPPYRCLPSLTEHISSLVRSHGIPCVPVVGITSPRIATTKEARLELARGGAQAVDMETYEILAAAHETGVPVAVLRVVADHLDMRLPDLNRALNDACSLDQRKALRVAIGSPILTARLISANKRAMRHLGEVLEVVLPSDCFTDARIAEREASGKTAPRG